MCGIAGFTFFIGFKGNVRRVIHDMTSAIVHRGPDEQGIYVDGSVALGNCRLSIIDLTTGKQPIHNEDKSLWIVFNGEIYNYLEQRKELEQKGHIFTTESDTEVIVHLYEEYQADCLSRLNGMFAVAIWDTKNQLLFLARDRLGIKPLHYVEYPGGIIFASEIKAILRHPLIEPHLDIHALNKYLTYEYIPTPHSLFKGIKKLEPGHYLVHTKEILRNYAYWDIPLEENTVPHKREEEYAEELLSHLQESVRKRLISDVPVGILLSGGLDSSTVSILAARTSSSPIRSFSIGFEEPSFDETRYSRNIARMLGTEHHHQVLSSRKMLELIPRITAFMDEPLADASILPTYLLANMTSQHVKVALGGDGADELFAGYPTYLAQRLVPYYSILPGRIQHIIKHVVQYLPVSHRHLSPSFKLKQVLRGIDAPSEIRFFLWAGAFLEHEKRGLFTKDLQEDLRKDDPFEDIRQYVHASKLLKDFERIVYLMLKLYLQDDILVKVDRASMANSLEVRVPYLDHTFVEYAARIPTGYKLHGMTAKYILKKAVKDILPQEIIRRKKKGFGVPLSKWFTRELKELLLSYLNEERIKKAGIFRYPYIQRLLDEHFSYKRDNRKQLWTLLVFEMWRDHYLR